jgi:cystathionine beta-lyase
MKSKKKASVATLSVHAGSAGDTQFGGLSTPLFPSSAYDYTEGVRYPRYFNTPNQLAVVKKLAALENGEDGLLLSSGMAAIMSTLFALVRSGDHVIFQQDLYGGTHHAVLHEFAKFGIDYTLVDAAQPDAFQKAIRKTTRVIFVETPSNPLLKITNLPAIVALSRKHKLISVIDNTFASPINQQPLDLGIDVVTHSGTKYIGGHSDLICGAVVASKELIGQIRSTALNFGGNADAYTCWLVERSLKTLALRVKQQNENALQLARWLAKHKRVQQVYYPGLTTHPGHTIAKKQMPGGFGGMLSFEVKGNVELFIRKLEYIKKAVSLGGVESTIAEPVKTSHAKLSAAERKAAGIRDSLVRLSVGIEDVNDLMLDLDQAL